MKGSSGNKLYSFHAALILFQAEEGARQFKAWKPMASEAASQAHLPH